MAKLTGPRLAPLSGSAPRSLVVLIHGYGSNGADMIGLAGLIRPLLPDAAFVSPNALSSLPHMASAYQWWPLQTLSPAEFLEGAQAAAPALDAFLDEELERVGLADDRLLLVGFSQGTMMALHVGLRRSRAPAGIVGFSGMLVAPERLTAEVRSRTPIMLVHGTKDEVVPFRSLDAAAGALRSAALAVETHVSPEAGHTVDEGGLSAAAAFAKRVLG